MQDYSSKNKIQTRYWISNFTLTDDDNISYEFSNIVLKIKMLENIKSPLVMYDININDNGTIMPFLYYGNKFNLKIKSNPQSEEYQQNDNYDEETFFDENLILVRIINPETNVYKKESTGVLGLNLVNESYYKYLQNKHISKVYRNKNLYEIIEDSFSSKNLPVIIDEEIKKYKFPIFTLVGNLIDEFYEIIEKFPIYFWMDIYGNFNFKMNNTIIKDITKDLQYMTAGNEDVFINEKGKISDRFFFTIDKVNTDFYFDEVYNDIKFENITYGTGESKQTKNLSVLGNTDFDMNDTKDAFYTEIPYEGINVTIHKEILNENHPDIDYLEERIKRITGVYWNNEFFIKTAKLDLLISDMIKLYYMDPEAINYDLEDNNYEDYVIKYKGFISQINHEFNKNNSQEFKYINGINLLTNNY